MERKEPLVSVIMNCYNGEKYLKEAIDSVLAQTYTNFEIIFWDNKSTDKSAEIVKSYNDNRIKYFFGEEHVSLGKARNLALEKAKGDYLAFLDVDDLWNPEKLNDQIPYFNESNIGLVYCLTNSINSEGKIVNTAGKVNKEIQNKTFEDLFINYDIVLSSSVISKKALITVNNFDGLLQFAEEYDLYMRICSGFKVIRINRVLASYRIHEKQDTLKLYERSIYEDEYIAAKLCLLYPNIFLNKPDLLMKKKKKIAWSYFLNFILKGDAQIGRVYLLSYIFTSFKYLVFYFLSFFCSRCVKNIWGKYRIRTGQLQFKS